MNRFAQTTRLVLASLATAACFAPAFACPPGGTTCPCNWDGVGGLDCADLRAYFDDYLQANACADINGVSGVTVQDFFDYLGCYQQMTGFVNGACGPGASPGVMVGQLIANNCQSAASIENGDTLQFDTRPCFNTDGVPEPMCFATNGGQIHNDTWFAYEATATGVITVTANHLAARLAVYDAVGFTLTGCPSGSASQLLSCAESGSNGIGSARLTVPVAPGNFYLIRAGGYSGASLAAGTINLAFVAAGVFSGGGTSTTAPFSVAANATGTGAGWSWVVQTATHAISGSVAVGVNGANATTGLRDAFIASLGGAGITTASIGGGDFTMTVNGNQVPSLWVGPSGVAPRCRVNSPLDPGAPAPCVFNPSIIALSGRDCNGNGIDDTRDILDRSSTDLDHDTVPDECNCPGDFNRDNARSPQDLFDFLAAFFAQASAGDFNRSGDYSPQDIFDFLAAFFSPCL